jgi:hypothetical protein
VDAVGHLRRPAKLRRRLRGVFAAGSEALLTADAVFNGGGRPDLAVANALDTTVPVVVGQFGLTASIFALS